MSPRSRCPYATIRASRIILAARNDPHGRRHTTEVPGGRRRHRSAGARARSAQGRIRGEQAEEAAAPAGRRSDRRLRPDQRGRPGDGLPLRRQGQLRPARHPALASGACAVPLRHRRREPRPEAAGLPRGRAAPLSRSTGRSLSDRRAGYLQRGEAGTRGRRDDVLAVLAPSPRCPLSRRGRNRRDQDRARPSPRRHPGDVLPQPLLRRQAEDDAAEARVRRRRARGDPAARVCARARPRPLRRPDGLSDHPVQPVRVAGTPATQAGGRHAARLGEEIPRSPRVHLQRAGQGGAVAPHGPFAVRFRGGARDRARRTRRRHRLRRRRGARARQPMPHASLQTVSSPAS